MKKTITVAQAKEYMKWLGLIHLNTGKPLSFAGFKQRAEVHDFGRGRNPLRIIYIGHPKQNLFGFYPMRDTKEQCLKDAYIAYTDLVEGQIADELLLEDYVSPNGCDIQWGNAGMPIAYGDLRITGEITIRQ